MKFKPPPKRKKLNPAASSSAGSPHCASAVSVPEKRDGIVMLHEKSTVHVTQATIADIRIRQARNSAVAEAQKDRCMSNFKIFDSPYGNYLVPVIPTRAELGG